MNASLKVKITGMAAIILCFNILVCGYGLYQINAIGSDLDTIVAKNNKLTEAITNVSIKHYKQALEFNRAFYAGVNAEKFGLETFHKMFIRSKMTINSEFNNSIKIVKEASKGTGGKTKKQFQKFNIMIKSLKSFNDNYTMSAEKVLYYLNNNQVKTAQTFKSDIESTEVKLSQEIEKDLRLIKDYIGKTTENAQKNKDLSMILMSVFSIISVLIGLSLTFIITGSIGKSVKAIVGFAGTLAEGDYTNSVEINNRDEIGEISSSLNNMARSNKSTLTNIRGNSETLKESSSKMSELSNGIFKKIEDLSENTNSVSSAVSQLNSNMTLVATAMENASSNVESVASAAEEMNTTVNEIANNSEKARGITEVAVSKSKIVSEVVEQLGIAARDISAVTETITDISEQTNLLALNATIEAARAGEAGKGFSVVANEIKELANQTASSTKEIRSRISDIQSSTEQTVSGIEEISGIINDVNDFTSVIATAVEEQSISTKEIAENASSTFLGINDVNKNITESTKAVQEISREISQINDFSKDIAFSSMEVSIHSKELDSLSSIISEKIDNFDIGKRRFKIGVIKVQYLSLTTMFESLKYPEMTIDLSGFLSNNECDLGKALAKNHEILKNNSIYKKLTREHDLLHELADKLIEFSNNDELEHVKEYLEKLNSTRVEMFKWLDELYSE
ncbi:MAG: HAMP domain-containing protein [Desulfobacterales bacterium]|nr:HAMP domain-containing protein [Desulfobacterales bacterium]MCP4159229.1 HAMP domain-containing protein [Deltaproteobacteria bacterium]